MLELVALALALGLVIITLPGTIELLLLTASAVFGRRVPSRAVASGRPPRLGVIIPVYNEEHSLAGTVRSVLACDDPVPASDIIVQACNCTDGSVALARKLGCTAVERTDPTRRGKGYGLNHVFRELSGKGYDGYIVLDADTVVERNLLNEFRGLFARGAVAGQSVLAVANSEAGMRPRLMDVSLRCMTSLRPRGRFNLGLSSGLFGNGFGLKASLVEEIPYESFSIAEDLEYHLELVRAGKTVEFLPNTAVYAEMVTDAREAKPQRARWEGGRLRVAVEQLPRLFAGIARGRLALIEPALDLMLLPLVYHALLLVLLMVLGLALGGAVLTYALLAIAALVTHVVAGMLLTGASFATWKALAMVPFYMAWKLVNLPGTLRAASKTAAWTRTTRIGEQAKPPAAP